MMYSDELAEEEEEEDLKPTKNQLLCFLASTSLSTPDVWGPSSKMSTEIIYILP